MGRGILFSLIGSVLAVFEISLCFDNAIVNANKLKDMTSEWQQRFLTWGILIAVFGMRIVCPLAVVVIAARIGPWEAIVLAAAQPDEYARIMNDAHISISAFGGTFLMMVALSYFIDVDKEIDRVHAIEHRLRSWATIRGLEIALVLGLALLFTVNLPPEEGQEFLFASVCGLLVFLLVELLGQILDSTEEAQKAAAQGGLARFSTSKCWMPVFPSTGLLGLSP